MKREWTALFFIANDNNLSEFTQQKVDEIATIGSTDVTNVVVQFDTLGKSLIRRFLLKKGRRIPLGKPLPETNTGDPDVLIRFINLTRSAFPSRRSMLVISNHGTGLDPDPVSFDHPLADDGAPKFLSVKRGSIRTWNQELAADSVIRNRLAFEAPRFRNVLFPAIVLAMGPDLNPGTTPTSRDQVDVAPDDLDNLELKAALAAVSRQDGPFDILVLEACLEHTFEVAYQLRNTARFMVGSQSNIPAPGWKFTPVLREMQDSRGSTTELVQVLVDNAVAEIDADGDDYAAISGLDLSKANDLAEAITVLAGTLLSVLEDRDLFDAISHAHYAAQAFVDSETVDLADFCEELLNRTTDIAIAHAAKDVQQAVNAFVVQARTCGSAVENAHGISIFLPRRDHISLSYRLLDFARETKWVAFLEAYLERLFAAQSAMLALEGEDSETEISVPDSEEELVGANA